jgi:hypothetical protein
MLQNFGKTQNISFTNSDFPIQLQLLSNSISQPEVTMAEFKPVFTKDAAFRRLQSNFTFLLQIL